jgi:AraC family transcriptional regulator
MGAPDPIVHREYSGEGFRVREVEYPAGHRQEAHSHDLATVTLLLAGSLAEWAGKEMVLATPLSAVVKPAGVEHADRFGPWGARTLQIQLRDATALGTWRWRHIGEGTREFLALARLVRQSEPPRRPVLERSILCVLSCLARHEGQSPREAAPHWIHRARRELEATEASEHAIGELAASLGVHAVSLARAFRRHYGLAPRAYRKHSRLRRAVICIARSGVNLTRIAHEVGYADLAHMSRQVREATGLPPTEIRALARPA